MKLIERLWEDHLNARKDRDTLKKNLLSTLIGDCCKNIKEPTDDTVITTIRSFITKAKETCCHLNGTFDTTKDAKNFIKTEDNKDNFDKWGTSITEIFILESYLPKQLTENEINATVWTCIKHGGMNLGGVMKHFKEHFPNQYDGKVVTNIIKGYLQ
jgi:hypothetical protein